MFLRSLSVLGLVASLTFTGCSSGSGGGGSGGSNTIAVPSLPTGVSQDADTGELTLTSTTGFGTTATFQPPTSGNQWFRSTTETLNGTTVVESEVSYSNENYATTTLTIDDLSVPAMATVTDEYISQDGGNTWLLDGGSEEYAVAQGDWWWILEVAGNFLDGVSFAFPTNPQVGKSYTWSEDSNTFNGTLKIEATNVNDPNGVSGCIKCTYSGTVDDPEGDYMATFSGPLYVKSGVGFTYQQIITNIQTTVNGITISIKNRVTQELVANPNLTLADTGAGSANN